jgi:hypothetical protein
MIAIPLTLKRVFPLEVARYEALERGIVIVAAVQIADNLAPDRFPDITWKPPAEQITEAHNLGS